MGTSQHVRSRSLPSSNWDIGQLPGLGAKDRDQLIALGIQTTLEFLNCTRTATQRQTLAAQLQVHLQYVNKWAALADLARIPAVGCQFCGLLLHAGVSSPSQLAQTPLPRLHQQMLKFQIATMQRQDLCPPLDQVSIWIQQARSLATV